MGPISWAATAALGAKALGGISTAAKAVGGAFKTASPYIFNRTTLALGNAALGATQAYQSNRYAQAQAQAVADAAAQNEAIAAGNIIAEKRRQQLQALQFGRELALQQGSIAAAQASSGLGGGSSDLLSALLTSASIESYGLNLSNAGQLGGLQQQQAMFAQQRTQEYTSRSPLFAAAAAALPALLQARQPAGSTSPGMGGQSVFSTTTEFGTQLDSGSVPVFSPQPPGA